MFIVQIPCQDVLQSFVAAERQQLADRSYRQPAGCLKEKGKMKRSKTPTSRKSSYLELLRSADGASRPRHSSQVPHALGLTACWFEF